MSEYWQPVLGEQFIDVSTPNGLLRTHITHEELGCIGNAPGVSREIQVAAVTTLQTALPTNVTAGVQQISVAVSDVTPLNLPPKCTLACITVAGGDVKWTGDGSTPKREHVN